MSREFESTLKDRIAAAFSTLAGWPPSTPPGTRDASRPARPIIIADTRFAAPAVVIADRVVARTRHDAVIVEAELRGHWKPHTHMRSSEI